VKTAHLVYPRVALAALLASSVLGAPRLAAAATYYVAPSGGSDTAAGAGTMAQPFATVGRAQMAASPGDTVFIRGGTFAFSGSGTVGVSFTKSGTAGSPINYFAYPSEVPVFDLSNLTPSNRVTGLDVHCSYIHIRGLEVRGVHQYMSGQDSWGVRIQGSNNTLEQLNVHNNDAPGIFITSGANNLVLNCDSHDNYDFLEGGGSGDGFGCHSSGGGNVLSGCRAYDNSDDGFDFINAAGSCKVQNSFAFRNGWEPGTTTAAGNGAGFKAGGYGSPPMTPASGAATHTVQQCVAFGNRAQGFYANHHPGRINFYNNTAFNNPVNFNMTADSGYPSSHVLRNNVAMATGSLISAFTGGTDNNNSWTPLMPASGSMTATVSVSAADFESVMQAEVLEPRQADGALPNIDFVHLVAMSDLIDKGVDVGLPFTGTAPDLGAYEFGTTTSGPPGTGGAGNGGAGGGAGNGGAPCHAGAGAGGGGGAGGSTSAAGSAGTRTTGGVPSNSGGGGSTSTGGQSMAGGATTSGGTGTSPSGGGTSVAGSAGSSTNSPAANEAADEGGCGCRLATRRQASGGALLGLSLLGLLHFSRRRRRAGT